MIGENTQVDARIELVKKPGGLGLKLRAAREAMKLSEKDAATRLHLKSSLITLMETEDFKNGPPAIFMRGYLRSYARLLNLNENEINQAIELLDIAANINKVPEISLKIPTVRKTNATKHVRWSTPLVAALLITLVGMWWHSHARYTVSDVDAPASALQQPEQTLTTNEQPSTQAVPGLQAVETNTAAVAKPAEPAQAASQETKGPEASQTAKSAVANQQPIVIAPPAEEVQPTTQESAKTEQKPSAAEDLSHFKMATDEPGLDESADMEEH